MLDVSVVVPARNAADLLDDCLRSVRAQEPREIIVVDGDSTDGTREIARAHGARLLSDGGRGLPYARMLGVSAARCDTVALIDADVVVPGRALRRLDEEFRCGGYDGLQAGLRSASCGTGYWGRALAFHQAIGLVRHVFGVSATVMRRDVLLRMGFDDRFPSGEDIDLRHRLERSGHRLGVSAKTHVVHRFRDGWPAATEQWLADGAGLGRMVRVHGPDHAWLLAVPLAAALRAVVLRRGVRWLPYFTCFVLYNYAAMLMALLRTPRSGGSGGVTGNALALTAARTVPMAIGFVFWVVAARLYPAGEVGLAAAAVSAGLLCSQLAILGLGTATINLVGADPACARPVVTRAVLVVSASALVFSGVLLATFRLPGLFISLSLAATVAFYLDHVAVALGRPKHALLRSAAQAVTSFATLLLFHGEAGTTILVAWNTGMWLSVLIGLAGLRLPAGGTRPKGLLRQGFAHHALTIADRAPALMLPVLVTATTSAELGAQWYVAWMIAMAAWYVPNSAAHAMQAELAGDRSIHNGIRTTVLVSVLAVLGLAVLSGPVLALFGDHYAQARPALLLLLVAVVPETVTQLALAADRAAGRFRTATGVVAATGLVSLAAGAVALHFFGITALAAVWLAGQLALACYGFGRIGEAFSATPRPARPQPAG